MPAVRSLAAQLSWSKMSCQEVTMQPIRYAQHGFCLWHQTCMTYVSCLVLSIILPMLASAACLRLHKVLCCKGCDPSLIHRIALIRAIVHGLHLQSIPSLLLRMLLATTDAARHRSTLTYIEVHAVTGPLKQLAPSCCCMCNACCGLQVCQHF